MIVSADGKAIAPDLLAQVSAADAGDSAPSSAGPNAPGAPRAVTAPVDPAREWIDAAMNFGGFLRAMHPITAREWTDDRLRAFGEALGKCAAHYGWTVGKLINHPLALVAVAAMPLAWPLAQPFVLQWIAAQRAKLQSGQGGKAANDANAGAKP